MPLIEEPGLYKRPCPRSPSHSVSTTNTLSGALCLRPLPSAARTSSRDCYRPHHPPPPYLPALLPPPSYPPPLPRLCHPPLTARPTCSTLSPHPPPPTLPPPPS